MEGTGERVGDVVIPSHSSWSRTHTKFTFADPLPVLQHLGKSINLPHHIFEPPSEIIYEEQCG